MRTIGITLCALTLCLGCRADEDDATTEPNDVSAQISTDAGTTIDASATLDASTTTRDAGAVSDAGAASRAGIHGPVKGTYRGTPFTATLRVTEFVAREGQVVARAVLENIQGNLPAAAIDALQSAAIASPVTFGPQVRPQAVLQPDGGADGGIGPFCDVLYLLLQPLHLDLLGAVVDLDRVILDVHAEPGPGNLLGNLLCGVAGLLDPTGPLGGPLAGNLTRVVGLLNDVLGSLTGAVSGR